MAKFRVRARTVDMLGRQQIAGIPTAVSELFKNAHDAYARNVEVDYFRDDGLFVLRDDGLGMTREDFEQRWLTLGTDSKVGSADLKPPPRDPTQPERPILGEKGIGRLAIAIIGPQVLVLTRANRRRKPSNSTIAAYLHWGLFELPGLNLEDISIPVREFQGGTLPNRDDVMAMVDEVVATLDQLARSSDRQRIEEIRGEMAKFTPDPLEYSEYLGTPSLAASGCGTHFYILPADPIIDDDIDKRQSDNKATRFEKHLIGFTNTMTPGHSRPPIIARFRDHRDEGAPTELIGERAFFTPEEFDKVDHHFLGHFDEHGQFRGQVGIYQMTPEDYVLNWPDSIGEPTECGPFSLSFAYMQGTARDSLVPPDEHARLRRKLDRHGGLYIFRDGIRVQPYGDSDYDWLDIERNRTLGAAYYFYSYRRMFGVVELTQQDNSRLTEKAGREGYRENKAYRQFRSILMNFFLQTAGDFFREDGKYSEPHLVKKEELNRNDEIRRKRATHARERRLTLQKDLKRVFDAIDEQHPELATETCVAKLKQEVAAILRRATPVQQKAVAIVNAERAARDQLREIRKTLTVIRPQGVGLSRSLSNEWTSYQVQMDRLRSEVFAWSETTIENYVSDVTNQAGIPLDQLSRLNLAVAEFGSEAVKDTRRLRGKVRALTKEVATSITAQTRKSFVAVSHTVDDVAAQLANLERSGKFTVEELPKLRDQFALQIESVYETERDKLERLSQELDQLTNFWVDDGYTSTDLTAALEEEVEELTARRDADLELAQIGLALNTINHEFEKTVGSVRDGLRRLKAWADANPELTGLFNDLRTNFDHLDEYLTLFTPLDRRLHRTKVVVTGSQIYEFLNKLFTPRLLRHHIDLESTEEFAVASTFCYPSSIYPPFVNLVDNSIFWLRQVHDRPRSITLDAEGRDFLVGDNGPGVRSRDRENIFVLNFTRKPGGRGMGLHISRATLARIGLRLTLDPPSQTTGAVFRISPANNSDLDATESP